MWCCLFDFNTLCPPCIQRLTEKSYFEYCHSNQATSHLDIRAMHTLCLSTHPVITRFPEIRGFPAALDSSSLIITLSIETVAMEAGDSELIGILGNDILAADSAIPKYRECSMARSSLSKLDKKQEFSIQCIWKYSAKERTWGMRSCAKEKKMLRSKFKLYCASAVIDWIVTFACKKVSFCIFKREIQCPSTQLKPIEHKSLRGMWNKD